MIEPTIELGRKNHQLLDAIAEKDVNKVKEKLADGADVNFENGYGWTPLRRACGEDNNYQIAKLLLKTPGIDVNKQNADGRPVAPLHMAAGLGNVGVLTLLLSDKRVDVNLLTKAACPVSALEKAITSSSNQALSVALLVMAGATFDNSSKAEVKKMPYPQQKARIEHIMNYQGAYRMLGKAFFPCVSLFNWVMDNKAFSLGIVAVASFSVYSIATKADVTIRPYALKSMLQYSQGPKVGL